MAPRTQVHGNEFHGARKDERTHAHGPQERETPGAHQQAIRHGKEKEANANRQHLGHGGPQGPGLHAFPLPHRHLLLHHRARRILRESH